ncbi:MAG TPA: hypothetical protein VH333_01890 [Pseudonocardiaceae bacterium]|jgi:hypothetical protein|nr:hypothetical protein [Pseudonocardiaceae bacterium]
MDKGTITISIVGANPDDLDELARSLRSDLQEISGLTIAQVPSTEPTEGTRSLLYVESIGSLAVGYYGGTMIKGIVDIVKEWIHRHDKISVTIEEDGRKVEANGLPADDIVKVLEARQRTGSAGAGETETGEAD